MGNGYWQKLLRVDLDAGTISEESIDEADLKRFIGGAALGANILWREIPEKIDAYDPRNRIILATGPFQGPPVPGGGKVCITGVSPLTGTFADTVAGGDFGPALKDAGFDAVVVQGASEKPVYIMIDDGRVSLKDASDLWGLDSYETAETLKARYEDKRLSVACIGPAGENKVAMACVVVDAHSFAGRCGMGAVMGAKGLKAIAARGRQKAPLFDPDRAKELMGKMRRKIARNTTENGFREHGTPALCEDAEAMGDMPIKYWSGDVWPEGAKKLGAPNSTEVLKAKPLFCKFCPVGCHRSITVEEPAEWAVKGPGPEYETFGLMGTNLMIDDPKAVAWANDRTNRLGLDTISAGAATGFAMECWEKGLITAKDTGGLEFKWGDPQALFTLIEQIGRCEGFGAIFAQGTLGAARIIGQDSEKLVAQVKGLDFPSHDPRSCISLAPTYATSTRGACHFRGGSEDVEMGGFFVPEIGIHEGMFQLFEPDNQAFLAAKCQDLFVVLNSLVHCAFMVDGGGASLTEVTDLFNAMTGWDYTPTELLETGERGFVIQRLINLRDGYGAHSDKLPDKMFRSAREGFKAGKVIPFERLMKDYYEHRKWDVTGRPRPDVLERLGL